MISVQDYCVNNTITNVSYNITKKSVQVSSKKVIARTEKIEDAQIIKKIHKSLKK